MQVDYRVPRRHDSTHSLDAFIALLQGAGVEAIADVRSTPFSRRLPHFNQGPLRRALSGNAIAYVPLGLELGGRGNPHSVRDEQGRISYRSIAGSPEFREGLQRVESGSARMRVALLCTEHDPLQCHRGILVSRVLTARGTQVVHIRADGATEAHGDVERRLLGLAGRAAPGPVPGRGRGPRDRLRRAGGTHRPRRGAGCRGTAQRMKLYTIGFTKKSAQDSSASCRKPTWPG